MDRVSKEKRSENMSRVRSKDTTPELIVRKKLHSLGFRYKLHVKNLPGKPDIVLPKYKTVIFVHGCFWHHHENCKKAKLPSTNVEFWQEKILSNVRRDDKTVSQLTDMGWRVLILWECEIEKNLYFDKLGYFLSRN